MEIYCRDRSNSAYRTRLRKHQFIHETMIFDIEIISSEGLIKVVP